MEEDILLKSIDLGKKEKNKILIYDMDETLAQTAGKMKMKFFASSLEGVGGHAQLLIRHPNFSGLQMNQISGDFIPAHYINSIEVSRGGVKILNVNGSISLSENPSLWFYFGDETSGDVSAVVTDTKSNTFKKSWINPSQSLLL